MKGEFDGVDYFMTTLSLSECREQLNIENTNQVKTFRERVQRTLDKDRAKEMFEKYLKKPQLRFFNSLVAVLIPPQGKHSGYYEFESFKSGNTELPFGMLKILTTIQRVVVDGQHRLHALKLAEEHSRELEYDDSLGLKEIKVPVLFLTFPSTGGSGFTNNYQDIDKKVSDAARRIFVDLNKNAKKADKKTLYILDDSDFSAVTARYIIESDLDFELFARWHGNGTVLSDSDHCFTTIEILDSMVEDLLGELEEKASQKYDLTVDEERNQAIQDYYLLSVNPALGGLSAKEIIDAFFSKVSFFPEWKGEIRTILQGEPVLQPATTPTTLPQRKAIKDIRQAQLLATVAGQKVAFKAILRALPHQKGKTGMDSLNHVISRLNKILELGIYNRSHPLWEELLVRPGNKMKLTTESQSVTILSALLEKTPVAKLQPKVSSWAEEGIGTDDTINHYASAYAQLA